MNFVFDFGGVVFQWRPAVLLERLFPLRITDQAQAAAAAKSFFQAHGGDWSEFDRGVVTADELARRISSRTDFTQQEVLAVVDAVPNELQPIEPTVQWLRLLKERGHRLFYLSNMPLIYADRLRREHDFLRWFDDGLFSSHVQLVKPDPAIYRLAIQRFGVPPETCVFLDDVLENVEAARSVGWNAVQFASTAQVRAQCAHQGWVQPGA